MVSLTRLVRAVVRRAANAANRWLVRNDGLSIPCLIVTLDPAGAKVRRMLERLPFYLDRTPLGGSVPVTVRLSLARILRAQTVIELDRGLLPPSYRGVLDNIFDVDFDRNEWDGWELCRIAERLAGLPTKARRADAHARLTSVIRRLRGRGNDKVYVFGTGPSLAGAQDRDFSDGHVIVCNTIVRDDRLWHHLNPDLFVAADAIYHFGHTPHAKAFRDDLRKRLIESEGRTHFAYPELFDAIVQREFPDLRELLIPVPFGQHTDIAVDLSEQFELPALGNVLNVLLLPLACTLSKAVWLWGFDGRAPNDEFFWANSGRHSYADLLPELREEHPAFFAAMVPKGRETHYVQLVHGDALDQRLTRAEGQGFTFVMMHFSWTETLNKRTLTGSPTPRNSTGDV